MISPNQPGEGPRVFISYSKADKPTADAICHALEEEGIRCWIAPRDLEPGLDWMDGITKAIAQVEVLVLVFSSHANRSPHVGREVALALDEEVTTIPFRIEEVTPSRALRYCISNTHWLDALTPPLQRPIETLIKRLQATLSGEVEPRTSRQGSDAAGLDNQHPEAGVEIGPELVGAKAEMAGVAVEIDQNRTPRVRRRGVQPHAA